MVETNKPTYNGSLTRERFLFYECKVVAKMILKGMTFDEILKELIEDNLFQLPSNISYKTIANACYKRLTFTGDNRLVDLVANASTSTAKFALIYCLMSQNLVVKDFMIDIIGEKYRLGTLGFDKNELNAFFINLESKVDSVSRWSDATVKRIKSMLIKCLVEANYLKTTTSKMLNQISVDQELIDLIRDRGDYEFLQAFNEI